MTWQTTAWAGAWSLASTLGPCTNSKEPVSAEPAASETAASARSEALSPPTAAASAPRQTATARAYMRTHFAQSEDMRRAVIGGDLAALQAAAEGVAKDEWTPNLRPDWRPHVAAVRSAARAAQVAPSLEVGAQALTDMGRACASCHLLTGGPGSPRFPTPLPGSTEPMLAHEIATEKLWQGLVAPSDAAWLDGADGLAAAPELDSDVKEIAHRAARVRDLARDARTVPASGRAKLFGDLLVTCANCHRSLDVQPSTPPPGKAAR